jgi:hypothetical protein
MISEVYDAFKEAGASEEKSRKAAEAIAAYETRFAKIENDLSTFRSEVRGEFSLVKWMIGFNLAIGIATLWKVFS